ncbi:proteasome maturation protein-like [Symsagittifera roscoffensis]|uniref:proteasome maturation protein-like n=1 Tax=Symsagittifera roscoffensis TaxID=84072 RepID=UPI00307BF7C9
MFAAPGKSFSESTEKTNCSSIVSSSDLGKLAENPLNTGFDGKVNLDLVHPLQNLNPQKEEREFMLQQLRHSEGLHLPMKMRMEERVLSKHERLPCLRSSHVLWESLTGYDEQILPRDMFQDYQMPEVTGEPHIMIESCARY